MGILVTKAHQTQSGDICEKLCDLILDGNGDLRDIYSIGLKTLIADVPEKIGAVISSKLCTRLIGGIAQDKNTDVKLECLDILSDLLKRFGKTVDNSHEAIMRTVQRQLLQARSMVTKRATACLGNLAVVLAQPLLNRLINELLLAIQQNEASAPNMSTLIQTIGTLSRVVGQRLGGQLDAIVPLFLKFCGQVDDEAMHTETADELRENCLQGFESCILRCPREISKHIPSILAIVLEFIKYDPNYTYMGDSSDEMETANDDDDEFDDEDMDDFSDDDDTA